MLIMLIMLIVLEMLGAVMFIRLMNKQDGAEDYPRSILILSPFWPILTVVYFVFPRDG